MKTPPADSFSALLRERGLRATPRRLQLLSLLARAERPMSAHEIKAKWKRGRIDLVTLYRALDALVAATLARRVDLRHGHIDYEINRSGNHHHHLVCTGCGVIEEVTACPGKNLGELALARSAKFASLEEHALEFFGTCKACVA